MKKAIIIVVVIALVILGAFVLLNKSQPQIQQAAQNASAAATDASMKATTAQLMVMVGQYYLNDKTGVPFEKNQTEMADAQSLVAQLQAQRGITASYSVESTENNYATKTMIAGASSFYCADSVQPTPDVLVVPVSGNNFTSSTDCTGQPLK